MAKEKQGGTPEESSSSLSNIIREYNIARLGLDMDSSAAQIIKGKLSYALNAVVENFDANSINYQNEPGNVFCVDFPEGYLLIGRYFINEQYKHIFFLTNPITGNSQIGYMVNNDCKYIPIVSDPCLGFSVNFPIHKVVHKITNCTTEIYWADNIARRYLDIDNVPYKLISGTVLCDPIYSKELDCNQLKIQPNFTIPSLTIADVISGGDIITGTYQFAIQYADAAGLPLTAYYSVTNPCPIFDPFTVSVNFNTPVGKSIVVNVDNLDGTGQFEYFNIAVLKTINNILSVDLMGTYSITGYSKQLTYTGQNKELTALSINDIFEKFPYYDIAEDLTTVQDVLVWKGLTTVDRINYQSIASKVTLLWETWQLPANEGYKEEKNAVNFRSYLRDEVYTFEMVFLLRNGRQTDGFHIPGRELTSSEISLLPIPDTDPDFIGIPSYYEGSVGYSPYWKIYNTGGVLGTDPNYSDSPKYKGPYQYGKFAYWESIEEYPCNQDVWGDLAGKKIRHHKFPDVAISPIHKSSLFSNASNLVMEDTAIFPIGVKIDISQVTTLIASSELTEDQKQEIVGFKIVRGNRGTNRSIIAKGMLRNVGTYRRENEDFFFPNYPYNDLNTDPFLNAVNNAWTEECNAYYVTITDLVGSAAEISIIDCNSNKKGKAAPITEENVQKTICSIGFPKIDGPSTGTVTTASYDIWAVSSNPPKNGIGTCKGWRASYTGTDGTTKTTWLRGWRDYEYNLIEVYPGNIPVCVDNCGACGIRKEYIKSVSIDIDGNVIEYINPKPENPTPEKGPCSKETPLAPIKNQDTYRQVFNSPETSFGQPFLGTILKLESVMFGRGKAHFVEVKDNAKYRLLTLEAQQDAFASSVKVGELTDPINPPAIFSAYQSYMEIYVNNITRKNYAYSFNSIASYNYSTPIPNGLGIKQRNLELARYLIPGVQSVGDDSIINNYNRETSVYLKTVNTYANEFVTIPKEDLPFPKDVPYMSTNGIEDKSRYTVGSRELCSSPGKEEAITVASFYGSIKNEINNQWGQIYSYSLIDTGAQFIFNNPASSTTIFGGDTFINKFAYKTKLPFFIDDRVNAPDDSDIFYDEIGNVAYPKYWHSSRSIFSNASLPDSGTLTNFFSYKAHEFDCKNDQSLQPDPDNPGELLPADSNPNRTFYDGIFYLYAYGIPSFYCESSYNVELRQAFNNKEGEFWPHVSAGIPDDWLQETNVTILQDNTYYYNITFSKQNKENNFTTLPPDWSEKLCYTQFPFRAIYSDVQNRDADNKTNNWLVYRAVSYFDFPQNYGNFTSIDGIEDRAVLARFENKTLMYNKLLTIDTSNPQAAYIGNSKLFSEAPPIDFSDTDLGFVGTQNKFLLKIPSGQITVDAKRGHIFLLQGSKLDVLSKVGTGMNSFLKEHLPFKILKHFPETSVKIGENIITVPGINIDNNFNGAGLHGVYDNRFERVLITKLDYVPLSSNIKFDPYKQEFYIDTVENNKASKLVISLTDPEYFCNQSFTLSYNLNTNSWISFHSYIPNYYVAENNFFYSGNQICCNDFDFIAGALVPTPTTTTTTTIFVPVCGPLMGTAVAVVDQCTPLFGEIILTDCVLIGTATQVITPCQRPNNVQYNSFIIGYTEAPDPYVDTVSSAVAVCETITYLNSLPGYTGIVFNYTNFEAVSLSLGATVYASNGTTDCAVIADGYYFNDESASTQTYYEILNGIIVGIYVCNTTTTTTTVTPCIEYRATSSWTPVQIEWLDCVGSYHIYITPGGSAVNTFDFCATVILNTGGSSIAPIGTC